MKSLNNYIRESLLDDEEDLAMNDDILIKNFMEKYFCNEDDYDPSTRSWKSITGSKVSYTIVDGNTIDISVTRQGSETEFLIVKDRNITKFPSEFKIRNLNGGLWISECEKLTTLEEIPENINGGLICSYCKKLKDLKGCPRILNGEFDCSHCSGLLTLEGAPEEVHGRFECDDCNKLKNLIGAPKRIINKSPYGCDLYCSKCNKLENLIGCPQQLKSIVCNNNPSLTSLKGLPENINLKEVYAEECINLVSMDGLNENIYIDKLHISGRRSFERKMADDHLYHLQRVKELKEKCPHIKQIL